MVASARRCCPILLAEVSHCRVASTQHNPEQEGSHQARNWQGGEWLDEVGVTTGPANWLDENGLVTDPESSFNAGAAPSCSAKSQLGRHRYHVEGMSAILEDVVKDHRELENKERTTKHCGS